MKINRLRLLGFKSFVEPTELFVEAGLTGIVGPNGCGKSNLLEALRWVMGETSHKSMRAAAMEDVIFSGTTHRPSRNSAEVTIIIDNKERQAPAEFNDLNTIEITRRIEREAGSAYRINGKEVRARDVKILFEDAATGARSPALVRQGQISEIVNSKPEQRRRILEDAAGIAGLHSRRHEAELRLKAAESNLARLGDVISGLSSQAESLKRQARQARKYKEFSSVIRQTEALVFHLSWSDGIKVAQQEESNLIQTTKELEVGTEQEAHALNEEARLAEIIPPLREAEAAKSAVVSRLNIELETLDKEFERSRKRSDEFNQHKLQLEKDIEREKRVLKEAREIVARLDVDFTELKKADENFVEAETNLSSELSMLEQRLEEAETNLADITQKAAEQLAHRRSLETAVAERLEAITRLEKQAEELQAQFIEIQRSAPDALELAETTKRGQTLLDLSASLERQINEAEKLVSRTSDDAAQQRDKAASAQLALSTLKTERETLTKLLIPVRSDDLPPVVDLIRVTSGYEEALGAALGDDLLAPIATDAAVRWHLIHVETIDPALPPSIEPLSRYVDAPPELQRRLSQVGIVEQSEGPRIQKLLRSGQRIVSLEGDLWRWDGYVATSGGGTPAAQRLAERNRITEIEEQEILERKSAQSLLDSETKANEALVSAQVEERRLRAEWRKTQTDLSETREHLTKIEKQARETETKLAAVIAAKKHLSLELESANLRLKEAQDSRDEEMKEENLEIIANKANDLAQTARRLASDAKANLLSLKRERQLNKEKRASNRSEYESWSRRYNGAEQQLDSLEKRLSNTHEELSLLSDLPEKVSEQRNKILSAMSASEKNRSSAADQLAEAENALSEAVQSLRVAQKHVSQLREHRARGEARLEAALSRLEDEARRINDVLQVRPEDCLKLSGWEENTPLPCLGDAEIKLQKLKVDRELLGGVNLQADEDLDGLLKQISSMEAEKTDVEQAVLKLRSAISQLNREGKKRLEEAFTSVNAHFQNLFTTLFGGGEARLEMVESVEDPLEGGLEIIAKPPGKKPATLSLLSGGEQTLTAISLLFAVFLTNPSPICVLDEVDAPLDDANVDRFCTLIEKIASDTNTRFLVITHHPMTMARMHRLFGVTMAERGVSQLVSVDLETAQSFREAG